MSRAPLLTLTALRVLAVTAISFSLLTACGKAQEAAEEAATEAAAEAAIESMTDADIDVDVQEGGQTVSGVDEQGRPFSTSQGTAAKIPSDFPSDVLVPEGLVLDTSMVVGANTFVGGTVPGDVAELTARIDAHMKAAGWTSLMAMNEPGSSTLLWQRDDRSVNYMIEAKPDGQLGVVISHAVEEKAPEAETAP
jgi:hypothetical protein